MKSRSLSGGSDFWSALHSSMGQPYPLASEQLLLTVNYSSQALAGDIVEGIHAWMDFVIPFSAESPDLSGFMTHPLPPDSQLIFDSAPKCLEMQTNFHQPPGILRWVPWPDAKSPCHLMTLVLTYILHCSNVIFRVALAIHIFRVGATTYQRDKNMHHIVKSTQM